MKLGLDIHGVLDSNPDFVTLAINTRAVGGEVHIITGSSYDEDLNFLLLSLSKGVVFWDYLISVQDELAKVMPHSYIDKHGRPCWDDDVWDAFKGGYCDRNNIDVHYDDTERYGQYFTKTTFILYKSI